MLKAIVKSGRYKDQVVRISNVSLDESGNKRAACILSDGSRANIQVSDLSFLKEEKAPEIRKAKTSSMPFIGGSTSSRTMTHTRNMARNKVTPSKLNQVKSFTSAICEECHAEYNLEERKGMPGKLTHCPECAVETENKVQGKMIFSHKTGATIEIKKDGELRHEAETFDPKNKT